MKSQTHNTALDERPSAHSSLLGCHRARFSKLLNPTEAAIAAAQLGVDAPPAGWLLYAELSPHDVQLLLSAGPIDSQTSVHTFDDGLAVVVLTAQIQGLRFQWAVPMWEEGAQEWLSDCVARGSVSMMFGALDVPVLLQIAPDDWELLSASQRLSATSVKRRPVGKEHLFAMLRVGLHLMNDTSARFFPTSRPPQGVRVMVASRAESATDLMRTFEAGAKIVQTLSPGLKEVIQ